MRLRRLLGIVGVLPLLGVAASSSARADEPVAVREPRMMGETAEITTVADAFDGPDAFDLNLIAGFTQSWKNAKVHRETQLVLGSLATGNFIPANENVATYSSSMSTLLVGADVGIYHDLALILRLPIILSWSQSMGDLNGSQGVQAQRLQDPMGGQLFNIPFSSPTRSGIDYFSIGADWAIYNQERDDTKPTWVIGLEGRIPVGTPLHACNSAPANGVAQCPDPSNATVNRDPGISRSMYSVIGKSIWSRRFGYVEPYTGFYVQADVPGTGFGGQSDFEKWNPDTNLSRTPPLLGTFMMGLEFVPYEHREQFQRLSADFRFKGTYHSPGRDYTELFDALGSSQASSLRQPNYASYTAGAGGAGSVVDTSSEQVYFSGITETQAFGSFTLGSSATWQAGEYIKFTVGGAFTFVQQHLVTAADTCNPNNGTPATAGPCVNQLTGTTNGVPNPDHRDIIDNPGHRFSVDDTTVVDLWVMGTVMF